jgi:glycosyltransferase involved in cell wall biosynthesis
MNNELTILMPCLNEAATLAICIQKAKQFLEREDIQGEILIADNGSSDGSQQIAQAAGARVIAVSKRGYGAALLAGIAQAKGRYIIMGDADNSYDFLDLMPFLQELRAGAQLVAQLVMGNRFQGGIAKGAMPFLNRYLGNPVLSFIGRLLFKTPIKDFHCGLRGFDRLAVQDLNLQAEGMEFASEMVAKASLQKLKITEVPTCLYPDGRNRPPHLRPFRDGWRHLCLLIGMSPFAEVLKNIAVLFFAVLFGAAIALMFGKEMNWDLANYHFYNPYVFLTKRFTQDLWPSSFVHHYFTPTADVLTYFLITHLPPWAATAMMGAIHGLNLWLLFCIARLFLNQKELRSSLLPSNVMAFLFALIGIYGPTALPGMGSFQQDNLISIFVLSFIYLQLRCFQHYAQTKTMPFILFAAGSFLLGLGVGMKLTAGLYVGAMLLTLLLLGLPFSLRLQLLFLFAASVLLGLLTSAGYWMLYLWQHYHNPFFPLWNAIFHSAFFPWHNWQDTRFLPKGMLQHLFFPFYFSFDGRTGDMPFQDFRFAIAYIVLAIFLFFKPKRLSLSKQAFSLFFIFSYLSWQFYFSIMRYAVVLEMLAPLFIGLMVFQLLPKYKTELTLCLYFLLATTMVPMQMIRLSAAGHDYFQVSLPAFVKQQPSATVLVAYPAYALDIEPRPQTYLIPFFPKDWRFIGIPFLHGKVMMSKELKQMMQEAHPPFYVLSPSAFVASMQNAAKEFNLKAKGPCADISSERTRITHEGVRLCRLD